jgi:hypothetical protein
MLLGGVEGVQVWMHPKASERAKAAAAALLKGLSNVGVAATAKEQNPQNPTTDKIDINVGTKF